jgi:Homeodomain-like domain
VDITPWLGIMAAPRRVIDITIDAGDLTQLERIARSRTEPASWVERARILLAYRADASAHAVGEVVGVTHQTVLRCLRRAVRFGVMAALDDSPRPGKSTEITADARAWLISLACRKAKDLGYPHELWTIRLLARHVRKHAVDAGHPCLASVVQGTVCKILARDDVKTHKVRYYLQRRDAAFETKMAEVFRQGMAFAWLRSQRKASTELVPARSLTEPSKRQRLRTCYLK